MLEEMFILRNSGLSPLPETLPFSTSQPEGMSMEAMGRWDWLRRARTVSKGARISPEKEKPKMPSRMRSKEAEGRVNGMMRIEDEGDDEDKSQDEDGGEATDYRGLRRTESGRECRERGIGQ